MSDQILAETIHRADERRNLIKRDFDIPNNSGVENKFNDITDL